MTTSAEIGHGVALSTRLRHILVLAMSHEDPGSVTLASADALLQRAGNEELNEMMTVFEDVQPLSVGDDLTTDRSELNEEFAALRDHWGQNYRISYLLDADEQNLRTHCRAEDIEVGQEFQASTAGADEARVYRFDMGS